MRAEKELLLGEIQDKIVASKSFIIAKYKSFSPQVSWELAKVLKDNGCNFEVVKKSVFFKAAQKAQISIDKDSLSGQIGVLFVNNDPIMATKTLCQFSEDNGELFTILSAFIDGKMYNAQDAVAMSKLPSLNVLRAQFLSVLEAPMAENVAVMQSVLTSIIFCIINKCQKDEVKP